jgi:hypothetical protein
MLGLRFCARTEDETDSRVREGLYILSHSYSVLSFIHTGGKGATKSVASKVAGIVETIPAKQKREKLQSNATPNCIYISSNSISFPFS